MRKIKATLTSPRRHIDTKVSPCHGITGGGVGVARHPIDTKVGPTCRPIFKQGRYPVGW